MISDSNTDSNTPEIVAVGSCNVDLITYTEHFPVVGETIEGRDFRQGFGGKGANQAVAAAKLGARVGMVARLGDDGFGRQSGRRESLLPGKRSFSKP